MYMEIYIPHFHYAQITYYKIPNVLDLLWRNKWRRGATYSFLLIFLGVENQKKPKKSKKTSEKNEKFTKIFLEKARNLPTFTTFSCFSKHFLGFNAQEKK